MGILLYLDLEFWEWTLKTLTPSLQENAIYFTTCSYLTLTSQNDLKAYLGGNLEGKLVDAYKILEAEASTES